MHFAGAMVGRLNAPATDITENVQHTFALNQTIKLRTIFTMIIKPPGFLTMNYRRHKAGVVLDQRSTIVFQLAMNNINVLVQTFDRT